MAPVLKTHVANSYFITPRLSLFTKLDFLSSFSQLKLSNTFLLFSLWFQDFYLLNALVTHIPFCLPSRAALFMRLVFYENVMLPVWVFIALISCVFNVYGMRLVL